MEAGSRRPRGGGIAGHHASHAGRAPRPESRAPWRDRPVENSGVSADILKKLSQSTKPSKVEESVADLHLVQGLYCDLQPVLEALDLPPEGIRY